MIMSNVNLIQSEIYWDFYDLYEFLTILFSGFRQEYVQKFCELSLKINLRILKFL